MKVDAEFVDSRTSPDADWNDPVVPEMPPVPATDDPPPPADNFLRVHFYDGIHAPDQMAPPIRPWTEPVTEENPLKADVCWSMRSPYSYLVLQRLVWLNSNYNVDITIRPVLPIAVRSTKGGSGKAGGAFGVWYKVPDTMWDTYRMAQYEGVPFKWASPDPIWQTLHPVMGEDWQYVHPPEKQPYIVWITRLACYCQKHGKSLDYVFHVSSLIWGDHVEHWPDHVEERFNRIDGLDYAEAVKYIQDNPAEIDQYWQDNAKFQAQAGHGGVPLMVFNDEPFFGGDRFNPFFQRLRQNGLTERLEPRAPSTAKPLRWPDGM
jgi:2-hydroxychromene-2-carboxylate isomerase